MIIRERITKIAGNAFLRSIAILVGGTALAQAISILILPFITRIYSPQDFSILAVYAAVLGITSVIACLRFEIAIPIAKNEKDAACLLVVALSSTMLFTFLASLLVIFSPDRVVGILAQPRMRPFLWLFPIGLLLSGTYGALQYWQTRKRAFADVARTRISQAIAGAGTQLGLGLLGYAPIGLLFGQMLSSGAGVIGLGYRAVVNDIDVFKRINFIRIRRVLFMYRRFPKYSALEALANSAATQVPLVIVAANLVGPEAGYLMLGMKVMQIPMALIGNSISQVYLSHAAEENRRENLGKFSVEIIGGLIKSGVGPVLFFALTAPEAFSLVFGEGWRRAGVLVTWMGPWFLLQFVVSPISMALHVAGQQRIALFLQVFGLIFRVGSVALAGAIFGRYLSEVYALSGLIFYAAYLYVLVKIISIPGVDIFQKIRESARIIGGWIAVGLIFKIVCIWFGWGV